LNQALPTITPSPRRVTFELDQGVSSGSAQSYHSISSGLSQLPPVTPPPPSESGTDLESRSEAEQEGYDLTSSETESQPVQRHRTKLRSRAVPSPRALRHVNRVRHVGPIGNKRGGRALDVWTFYLPEDGGHVCVFCKYVIILFL
jgi:hypothetical protein